MIRIQFTDGTQVVALTGAWVVLDFSLPTPEVKGSDTDEPTSAGGERFHMAWRNVSQTIEVMYIGDSNAFLTRITQLENMFNRAAERQSNPGVPRLFIERQVHDGGDWYRSEILFGRLDYDPNTLHYPWPKNPVRVFIGIRRRYYWEDVTQRQIPLATTGVSKTTNFVNVWNHTDASETNFVDIDAVDVVGSMPSPVTVRLANQSSDAETWLGGIYISRNVNANPRLFSHMIEAENISMGTLVPGANDFVNYSAGRGREINIYNVGTMISLPDLDPTFLTRANFQYFHLMVRLLSDVSPSYQMWSQVRLTRHGLTVLWQGDKIFWKDGDRFRDLGTLPIPPWLANAPKSSTLRLQVTFGHNQGSFMPYTFDFFELLPVDSWMYIQQLGYYIQQNDQVVYDGDLDRVYGYFPSSDVASGIYTRFGAPIMVHPGMDQRFYFHHVVSASAPLNKAYAVQMFYRPRRLSL